MRRIRRRYLAIVIAVAVAVAGLLILTLVPIRHGFSIPNAAIPDLYTCSGLQPTQGTIVTFHWTTSGNATVFVVSCSLNEVVYEGNGTQGSGSFVANGGMYVFGSGCPGPTPCYAADVAGTYTGPLLPL